MNFQSAVLITLIVPIVMALMLLDSVNAPINRFRMNRKPSATSIKTKAVEAYRLAQTQFRAQRRQETTPAPKQAQQTTPATPAPKQAQQTTPATPAPKQAQQTTPATPAPKQAQQTTPATSVPKQAQQTAPQPLNTAGALVRRGGSQPVIDNSFCRTLEKPGVYADVSKHCKIGYICDKDNNQYSFSCPAGEVFFQAEQQCKKPIRAEGCPQTGAAGPDGRFVLVEPQSPASTKKPLLIADASHQARDFCKAKSVGSYPDEKNRCASYYVCRWNGQHDIIFCDSGKVFNKYSGMCVSTNEKRCPKTTSTGPHSPTPALGTPPTPAPETPQPAQDFCQGRKAGLYPDVKNNCNGYYLCRSERSHAFVSCGKDKVFNDYWSTCVDVPKGKKGGCPIISGVPKPPTHQRAEVFCMKKSNGAYPDTTSGYRFFYYCSKNYQKRIACPLWQVFDTTDDRCTDM